MDSLKKISESRNYYLVTLVFTLILMIFFFLSASDDKNNSPAISYTSLASSRIRSLSNKVSPRSSPSQVYETHFVPQSFKSCTTTDADMETCLENSRNGVSLSEVVVDSCDLFDGRWVLDEGFEKPIYEPGSCPFIDDAFSCFKNGRPDLDYLRLKWKPYNCEIPRFNGLEMLKMLRGKRMVFVGDSLNRNMWESLVCAMRESLEDKRRVFEISGRRQFKSHGFYSFNFQDFNCSIDFIKSPFLVQEWKFSDKAGTRRETLRLDVMEGSHNNNYSDADIIVFNTGHWWTHQKTFKGKNYFQEGNHIYTKLEVEDAYKKALKTWAGWVDANVNSTRTRVFFRGYSASHFKGGRWNSGGGCDGETRPISNDTHLAPYPWMMRVLESVISKMKTPVLYLNITKMTDYRKDGHPSVYRQRDSERAYSNVQDCSHWCLPGVPDTWNQLLYAVLVRLQRKSM